MILLLLFLTILVIPILFIYIRFVKFRHTNRLSIGFFHPYCNAGGGGERVLWCAIKAMQQINADAFCIVYTGDDVTKAELFKKVKSSFGIEFSRQDRIDIVKLSSRGWVEESRYPMFTMLGQSLGSMVMALEALSKTTPHIMMDTMGYAFTYPIFRFLGGCRVGCYVHYPTISTDMLARVVEQRPSYNNNQRITSSKTLSGAKYIYYRLFALLYGMVGRLARVVLVNSTWTQGHIAEIWRSHPHVVYPPCDTTNLTEDIPLNWANRENTILSIGQFRPEKDHVMQLHVLQALLNLHPELRKTTRLVLVGSVRNQGDEKRLAELRDLALQLGLERNVEFELNVPFARLKEWLSVASVGIHTMWNEHFGIGIVELMAAGVIVVAHNSGGPKEDIVKRNVTGMLASSIDEYAERIGEVLIDRARFEEMQQAARSSVSRFSEEKFMKSFVARAHVLFHNLH